MDRMACACALCPVCPKTELSELSRIIFAYHKASAMLRCPAATPLPPAQPSRRRRAAPVTTRALANTFGTAFRVTTFGESHGGGVGCVVDGVPPRLQLTTAELQARGVGRAAWFSLLTSLRSSSWTGAGRGRAASRRRATRRTCARFCQVQRQQPGLLLC